MRDERLKRVRENFAKVIVNTCASVTGECAVLSLGPKDTYQNENIRVGKWVLSFVHLSTSECFQKKK